MTKSSETKTIEISIGTYNALCGIITELEEIFKRKVSFDMAIKVLKSPKLVDFTDLINENKIEQFDSKFTEEKTE